MYVVWKKYRLSERKWGCPHSGPGRMSMKGVLVESYRPYDEDGPRQWPVDSLPVIRSCCADKVREAVWHKVLHLEKKHKIKISDEVALVLRKPSRLVMRELAAKGYRRKRKKK